MKKITKILIGINVIFLMLIIYFGAIRSDNIKKYGFDFVNYAKYYLLQSPIESLKDSIVRFNQMNNWEKDYQSYKQASQQLQTLKNENEELKRQIDELSRLNNMQNTNSNFEYKSATIINRDVQSFNDEFIINIGENEGIQVGMIVVGNAGVVGKIQDVSKYTSTVSLITSKTSINQISASIIVDENNRIDGIVRGFNRELNRIELRILNQDIKVNVGSSVITSGLGQLYPAGITIGKVSEVKSLENELGQELYVEVAQELDQLRFVSVIVGSK